MFPSNFSAFKPIFNILLFNGILFSLLPGRGFNDIDNAPVSEFLSNLIPVPSTMFNEPDSEMLSNLALSTSDISPCIAVVAFPNSSFNWEIVISCTGPLFSVYLPFIQPCSINFNFEFSIESSVNSPTPPPVPPPYTSINIY